MPGGKFSFVAQPTAAGETNISASPKALQAHLDSLLTQIANGTSPLPSFDAVPTVLDQADPSSGEEPVPLDRSTLQTLLAVDGRRTVLDILTQRGSLDALWQLGNLMEVGLLGLVAGDAPTSGQDVPGPGVRDEVPPGLRDGGPVRTAAVWQPRLDSAARWWPQAGASRSCARSRGTARRRD